MPLELGLVEEPVRALVPVLDGAEAVANEFVLVLGSLVRGKTLHTPLNALLQRVTHSLDILKPMITLREMSDEDECEKAFCLVD